MENTNKGMSDGSKGWLKPGERETHFQTHPAAGSTADQATARNQWQRQRKELKKNPGKEHRAALEWEQETQKANGRDKGGGWQKEKGGTDESPTIGRLLLSGSCDEHFGSLIQLQAFKELPYAHSIGHRARTDTRGLALHTCQVS